MSRWLVFIDGAAFCFFAILTWAMWIGNVSLNGVEMVGKIRLAMTIIFVLAMIKAFWSTSVGG